MCAPLFHLLHMHFHCHYSAECVAPFFLITLYVKHLSRGLFFIFSLLLPLSASFPSSSVKGWETHHPLFLKETLWKLEISACTPSCHLRLIAWFSPALAIIAPLLCISAIAFRGLVVKEDGAAAAFLTQFSSLFHLPV